MRKLIEQLTVMSKEEILPVYGFRRWFAHRKVKWRRHCPIRTEQNYGVGWM
ncbi:MAG: hypothetical protein ACRDJ4_13675 [Actinomycetota bacterium]